MWAALALYATACIEKIVEVDGGSGAAPEDVAADLTGLSPSTDAPTGRTQEEIGSHPDATAAVCEPACAPWFACVAGNCGNKGCAKDSDCNAAPPGPDEAPHWCYKGKCAAYQCAKDAECPTGQLCNPFTFSCYLPPKGCTTILQCDDGDICTTDSCQTSGACAHKALPGCCHNDFGCDDGKACTSDKCKAGACNWVQVGQCCSDGKDCNDNNACTQDLCQGGVCAHSAAPGCCKSALECDDLDPTSSDGCVSGTCTHVYNGLANTCSAAACTQNACTKGTCANGFCTYAKLAGPTCCTADAQCLIDGVCQKAMCSALTCGLVAVKGSGPHLRYRFDTAAVNGWTVEKSSMSVYFHFSTLTAASGPGALRFGIPGKISFEDLTANKGAATSAAITLPASPGLRFWTLLDVSPGTAIHQCGIDVMDAATGAKLASVWSKNVQLSSGTTAAKWMLQEVVVPANLAGKAVKLRAWFDQLKYDTSNKEKLGWLIDELEVVGACP